MLLNHSGSKAEWFRTDSGTSYQLSKSKASLSSRVASKQLCNYSESGPECQHWKKDFFAIPTRPHNGARKRRIDRQIRARSGPDTGESGGQRDRSQRNETCIPIFLAAQSKLLVRERKRGRQETVAGRGWFKRASRKVTENAAESRPEPRVSGKKGQELLAGIS